VAKRYISNLNFSLRTAVDRLLIQKIYRCLFAVW